MLDLDEEGQHVLITAAVREMRRMCDAFQLPYSDVQAEYQEDPRNPGKPPVLYKYTAPDEKRVVTFTSNTIRLRLPDLAAEYHAEHVPEFARTLGSGVIQFPPSVQLMLFLFANDMTANERSVLSGLLWNDPHPDIASAMYECWDRYEADTAQKFGTIMRGYMCSAVFDKRSIVLDLARSSPSAGRFWGEMRRLVPLWGNYLPLVPSHQHTPQLAMCVTLTIQAVANGIDELKQIVQDSAWSRFSTVRAKLTPVD